MGVRKRGTVLCGVSARFHGDRIPAQKQKEKAGRKRASFGPGLHLDALDCLVDGLWQQQQERWRVNFKPRNPSWLEHGHDNRYVFGNFSHHEASHDHADRAMRELGLTFVRSRGPVPFSKLDLPVFQ